MSYKRGSSREVEWEMENKITTKLECGDYVVTLMIALKGMQI